VARLIIVGLGPAGLERIADPLRGIVVDPGRRVLVRTLQHPAAEDLAALREIEACDDIYDGAETFDEVYQRIADRVLGAAAANDVVYAVPGSALVGERTVEIIREQAPGAGVTVEVLAGESFIDAALERVGLDPLQRGFQVLDGRALPDPLILHLPTLIAQADQPMVLAEIQSALGRTLPGETPITVLSDLGADEERVEVLTLGELPRALVGPRTSLFLDPPPSGWYGLVLTNRILRTECPWDARQTHHSLVSHLVEETYELVEAISELPAEAPGGAGDYDAYVDVEEELGDVLLQVVFHATLAAESGAFDVEEVAEGIRRKLVERHSHVFGDVDAPDADAARVNWEREKQREKGRASLMDGVISSLPALARATRIQQRAAAVGFDWPDAAPVLDKVVEEVGELRADLADPTRAGEELGDLLFSVVNLARHLEVDPELALRGAADRFAGRFRVVEALAAEASRDLGEMSLDELEELWQKAKRRSV